MAEYIEREAALSRLESLCMPDDLWHTFAVDIAQQIITKIPAADVAPVVMCHDCIHAVPLERNCELNTTVYMHCTLGRGEEIKNVWHKYKRYYRDYSIVEHESFCDQGERMADNGEA